MKRNVLFILIIITAIMLHPSNVLAVIEKGILMPVEGTICMEGETHVLVEPCDQIPFIYLKIANADPLLIGAYVEVEGILFGLLCPIIDVETIILLDDPDLDTDQDGDGLGNFCDNCPTTPNATGGGTCIAGVSYKIGRPCTSDNECGNGGFCSMNQEDSNQDGIGDACYLCESDFLCDGDVDAEDVTAFLTDFGRGTYDRPCINEDSCKGDFSCDGDVDAEDVTKFLEDFGRGLYSNPCPICNGGAWCDYPPDPEDRFIDNEDGTVTDNNSGLMWLKNANCFSVTNWFNAMDIAATLASGQCGLSDSSTAGDWRLPTKEEWGEFVCSQYDDPAVCNTKGTGQWSEGDPFDNVQPDAYWSSTEYFSGYAMYVDLYYGGMNHRLKTSVSCWVWPVRGGQ